MNYNDEKENIQTIWKEIRDELQKISPEIGASFNNGATENEILELEKIFGKTLPEDFKNYLRLFNGQNDTDICFFGYNSLLSIKKMIGFYQMQIENFGDEEEIGFIKPNKIQPMIWSKGWLAFADFEASSQLIIDLNPAQNGTYGQIITMWAGMDYESDTVAIAYSFLEFSQKILEILQQKNYTLANDGSIENDFLV